MSPSKKATNKYRVGFVYEDEDSFIEIQASSVIEAGEMFASRVCDERDMHECGNHWSEDDCIIVVHPDGTNSKFEVLVDYNPEFKLINEETF